jgi:hypothetical protein
VFSFLGRILLCKILLDTEDWKLPKKPSRKANNRKFPRKPSKKSLKKTDQVKKTKTLKSPVPVT